MDTAEVPIARIESTQAAPALLGSRGKCLLLTARFPLHPAANPHSTGQRTLESTLARKVLLCLASSTIRRNSQNFGHRLFGVALTSEIHKIVHAVLLPEDWLSAAQRARRRATLARVKKGLLRDPARVLDDSIFEDLQLVFLSGVATIRNLHAALQGLDKTALAERTDLASAVTVELFSTGLWENRELYDWLVHHNTRNNMYSSSPVEQLSSTLTRYIDARTSASTTLVDMPLPCDGTMLSACQDRSVSMVLSSLFSTESAVTRALVYLRPNALNRVLGGAFDDLTLLFLLAVHSTSLLFARLETNAKESIEPAVYAHMTYRLARVECENPLANNDGAVSTAPFLNALVPPCGEKAFRSVAAFTSEFGRTPQTRRNHFLPAAHAHEFGSESTATVQSTRRVFTAVDLAHETGCVNALPVLRDLVAYRDLTGPADSPIGADLREFNDRLWLPLIDELDHGAEARHARPASTKPYPRFLRSLLAFLDPIQIPAWRCRAKGGQMTGEWEVTEEVSLTYIHLAAEFWHMRRELYTAMDSATLALQLIESEVDDDASASATCLSSFCCPLRQVAFDHDAINPAACAISCYFYPPFVTLFQLLANFATTAAPGPVAEEVHSFAEALQAHIVDETIVNELAWLHGQDALEGLEREEDLERRRSLEHLLDELSRRSQREALPRDVSARASSSTPPPSPSLRSPPSSSPPRAQQPQTPTFSSPPPASSSSNSASGTARSSCLFGSEPDPPSTDFTLPDDQAPPSSKRPALSSSTEGTLPAGTTEKAPPKLRAVLGDITNSKAPVSDVASTSVAPDKSPPAAAFAGQSRDLGSTLPPPSSPGVPVATQTDGPHGSEANDDAPERAVSENGGADQDWAPSISGSQAESESGSESEDDQADLLADLMKLGDTDQSSHRPTTQALVGNIADRLTLTLRARLPIITLLVRQIFSEFSNPDQNSVPALFRDRSPLSLEQYLALAPEPANPLVVDPLYLVVHIKLDGILRQDDQQSQLWTDAIATLCSVWNAHLDGPVPVVSRSHLVNTAAVTASMRRSSSDPDEDSDEEDADSEDAFVPIPSKRRRVAGIRARARTRPRAVET